MYLRIYVYMENVIVWLEHAQCLQEEAERVVGTTCDPRNKAPAKVLRRERVRPEPAITSSSPGNSGATSPALHLRS